MGGGRLFVVVVSLLLGFWSEGNPQALQYFQSEKRERSTIIIFGVESSAVLCYPIEDICYEKYRIHRTLSSTILFELWLSARAHLSLATPGNLVLAISIPSMRALAM